jgi:hypothetical protein
MTVAPGGTTTDVVVFANGGATTQVLTAGTTEGTTAANSGSAFRNLTGTCTGVACWVTGIPKTITLPPHTSESVTFRVTVPAGARPMQYLAGITARPAALPQPVPLKSSGHSATKVTIVTQVTIGVAITVGQLASLHTSVDVTRVTAGWIGTLVRLSVDVRNGGQRFTKGNGDLSCTLGGTTRTYLMDMNTVLPGDGTALPVNGTGMHVGNWLCTARIKDSGGSTATWTGKVVVASAAPAATKRVASGVYVVPPGGGIPGWAIALIVLAGLILLSLWAVLFRRGRNRNLSNPGS